MTELDFDELDKAVNSLMADTDKPAPDSSTSASTPPSTPATPAVSSTITPPVTPEKPAMSSLPTKRRGQFMDVIRPSGAASKPAAAGPMRRQGVTIAPVTNNDPLTPPAVSTTTTSIEPVAATAEPETTPPKSEWPDPIDLATPANDTVEAPSDQPSQPTATDESAPLDSPFLPDAKPEKRPLGALQAESDLVNDTDTVQEEHVEDELPPSPVADSTKAALPEELHSSLVSIESDTTLPVDTVEPAPEIAPEPEVAATPIPEPIEEVAAQPQAQPEVPAGGAITQQYKEEPSSGDQTNGSIYDTANYHKAIEAHAGTGKKSSAIKWIMWIVLLLILGIGGGAAAFMLTR